MKGKYESNIQLNLETVETNECCISDPITLEYKKQDSKSSLPVHFHKMNTENAPVIKSKINLSLNTMNKNRRNHNFY
jgi:hypothetical protein